EAGAGRADGGAGAGSVARRDLERAGRGDQLPVVGIALTLALSQRERGRGRGDGAPITAPASRRPTAPARPGRARGSAGARSDRKPERVEQTVGLARAALPDEIWSELDAATSFRS